LKLRAARLAGNLITIFEGNFNMKNDKYLKIILTIIAICLVWICVRDVKIGGNYLFAGSNGRSGQTEVYLAGGKLDRLGINAFLSCGPIEVEVVNLPKSQELDTTKK